MKAILFDLDGTLLPMDQDLMIKDYMKRLAGFMAAYGYEPETFSKAIWNCTGAMVKNEGLETNEAVFWKHYCAFSGKERMDEEPVILDFYYNDFQLVQNSCGFDHRAGELIRKLKQDGYILILATNPLFPAVATNSRIRWAGLSPEDFVLITSYENSSFAKPNPDYYREILSKQGLKPDECMMVGNDVEEDMIAGTLGMKTFLLTDCLINKYDRDISCYRHGSFPDLMDYIGECELNR